MEIITVESCPARFGTVNVCLSVGDRPAARLIAIADSLQHIYSKMEEPMSIFDYQRQTRKTCIEPEIGRQVYDYYNGLLAAHEVRLFEQHMIRCAHCERTVLELDATLSALDDLHDFGALIDAQDTKKTPFASWLDRRLRH
ncbi:MAG: hypothetical protein IPM55_13200 [Acidobacteria bacterium]|nr:hypothetical protein [Acidobacteriota bacterium]